MSSSNSLTEECAHTFMKTAKKCRDNSTAYDLYDRAEKIFASKGLKTLQGECLMFKAEICAFNGNRGNAAEMYYKASKYLRSELPEQAVICLKRIIGSIVMGISPLPYQKGSLLERIAEIQEHHFDYTDAVASYIAATKEPDVRDNPMVMSKCLYSAGVLSMQLEKYKDAIPLFYKTYRIFMKYSILQWNVERVIVKMVVCMLMCEQFNEANSTITRLIPSSSNGAKFLEGIIRSIHNRSLEEFCSCVSEYDKIVSLDTITTTTLLRLRGMYCDAE